MSPTTNLFDIDRINPIRTYKVGCPSCGRSMMLTKRDEVTCQCGCRIELSYDHNGFISIASVVVNENSYNNDQGIIEDIEVDTLKSIEDNLPRSKFKTVVIKNQADPGSSKSYSIRWMCEYCKSKGTLCIESEKTLHKCPNCGKSGLGLYSKLLKSEGEYNSIWGSGLLLPKTKKEKKGFICKECGCKVFFFIRKPDKCPNCFKVLY